MKNKTILLILLVLSLFIVTACENQTTKNNKEEVISNGTVVKTGKMKHKKCTRQANGGTGVDVELNYDVYYTDDILNLLVSQEKIITEDISILEEYEDAYKKISVNYKGLEYYDQEVIRTNNSVLNKTTINYDKIDIQKLLDIEGEEDNIIEDGKAKVDLYISLLKRFGGTCEDVE